MQLVRRAPRLPSAVRDRLELERGEKLLAVGELTDGWAAATTTALHVALDLPVDGEVLRRAWTDVDRASLEAESAELTVTWVDGSAPTVLHLADDTSRHLPQALHERVQSSVVHSETVTLPRGVVVRVALRRTASGPLVTQVIGPAVVDLGDPATAALVDAAEVRVRGAAGLR